jgi:glutamine synthetase adenylyltransferase
VQALQMRAGIWEPSWEKALNALQKSNVVTVSDSAKAAQSYNLLRQIETALRRFENRNVSALPGAAEGHEKLAKRLGYKNLDLFTTEYRAARETIRSLYERYIKKQIT